MSESSTALSWVGGYTRLYAFPTSLNLSSDNVVEDLLADIPMFGVGLLSFGVFTFFLVMKRVNILAVVLYTSVLMAFVASILDLSHVLGSEQSNKNNNTDKDAITSLVIAREIGFAISIGLRFFFFWLFVAEPPRKESVVEFQSNLFSFKEPTHSGAWGRWGLVGVILKYSLLAIVVIIGVFQIDWRVAPGENRMGAVYGAEATMEILASALFILKLVLNTYITPVKPVSRVIRSYAAMFIALVINLGLGIGNVATFAFSESTLGRFLQAVELYILILYVLISSFYNYVPAKPTDAKSGAPFQGLPESKRRSTFRISPFTLPADPFLASVELYQTPPYVNDQSETPSRRSIASRLSSWIASQRLSKSRLGGVDDQTQLWDQDRAERGQSPVDLKANNSIRSPYSYESVIDKPKGTPNSMSTTVMRNTEGATLSRWTTGTLTGPSRQNSFKDGSRAKDSPGSYPDSAGLQPPRMRNDSSAAYSIGSYYGGIMNGSAPGLPPADNNALAARNTDSPIYGLNGITRHTTSGRQTPPSSRSTVVSFTELLRKQKELDNSIVGLRLLSSKPESQRNSGSGSAPVSPSGGKDRYRSTLTIAEPSATRSEFSLSSFPEPPMMFSSVLNEIPSSTTARTDGSDEGRSRSTLKSDGVAGLPLPRMPILDDIPTTPQPIPDSPGANGEVATSSRMGKFDSAGTQYDVTSFIGHLTTPGKGSTLSKVSSVDAEDRGSDTNKKPTHSRKQSGNLLVPPSADNRSNVQNSAPTLSLNSNQAGTGEIAARRRGPPAGVIGLPARPKLTISGPRLSPQDGQAPNAFERPRPPPLILQQPNGIVTPPGRSL